MRTRGWREARKRALKSLRATAGLSQLDVAERLGVTERRYWLIENGYSEPTEHELNDLAKILKVEKGSLPLAVAS